MRATIFFIIPFLRIFYVIATAQYSEDCVDRTTDCIKKVTYCSNHIFEELMRTQCRRTCGFCDDSEEEEYFEQIGGGEEEEDEESQELYTETPTVEETTDTTDEYPNPEDAESHTTPPEESTTRLKKSRSCVDSGRDCNEKLHLCHNVIYSGLMARMCRRSCNLCDSNVKPGSVSAGGINSIASLLNCGDASSDCQQRISYCHNPLYSQLMSQMCRKTCSLC